MKKTPITSILLVLGFSLQMLAFYLARQPAAQEGSLLHLFIMLPGLVLFTLGSMSYAHQKGRLWIWGLLGIIWPFFLVLLLIPSRKQ